MYRIHSMGFMALLSTLSAALLLSTSTLAHPLRRDTDCLAARAKKASTNPGFDAESVLDVATSLSSHSWEYGLTSLALLDWYSPKFSVWNASAFPDGKLPTPSTKGNKALIYAKPFISTTGNTLVDGDGALGDPASLVTIAALIGQSDSTYAAAVTRQINHVLAGPKFYNGAISQREDVAELWADAMNMIPPSLAYYAVSTKNVTLMQYAVKQAGKYREVLQANTTASWNGLWTHIVGPQSQTLGIWATGNGWAVLGMARMFATIKHWSRTEDWDKYPADLQKWIYEILDGAKAVSTASNGLMKNYLVGDDNSQNNSPNGYDFGDATSSAMFATVVYRMCILDHTNAKKYLSWANGLRKSIAAYVGSDGYIRQNVDPLNWYSNTVYTKGSPEGQAAAVMMAAAWRDCVRAGKCSS